jgi:hypothetical protein
MTNDTTPSQPTSSAQEGTQPTALAPIAAEPAPEAQPAPRPRSVPGVVHFVSALIVVTLTFGGSIALMTRGAGSTEVADPVTRTSAPLATAAATTIRVAAGDGTAERLPAGTYRVTYTWTIDGARDGDAVLIRFAVGNRVLSEQRAALDPNIFSSGKLTIATEQDCSAQGWSAEILSVRGVAPVGDFVSRVAAANCG